MSALSVQDETSRIRIAVADDEAELRDYWQVILPRLGYDLAGIVGSGEDLVGLCQKVPPDVVITDVYLPGLSGLDAIEAIRHEQKVGVVFVTGRRCEDESVVVRSEQFVILAKPFATKALPPAVGMALRRAREASQQTEFLGVTGRLRSVAASGSVHQPGGIGECAAFLAAAGPEEVAAALAKRTNGFH